MYKHLMGLPAAVLRRQQILKNTKLVAAVTQYGGGCGGIRSKYNSGADKNIDMKSHDEHDKKYPMQSEITKKMKLLMNEHGCDAGKKAGQAAELRMRTWEKNATITDFKPQVRANSIHKQPNSSWDKYQTDLKSTQSVTKRFDDNDEEQFGNIPRETARVIHENKMAQQKTDEKKYEKPVLKKYNTL